MEKENFKKKVSKEPRQCDGTMARKGIKPATDLLRTVQICRQDRVDNGSHYEQGSW